MKTIRFAAIAISISFVLSPVVSAQLSKGLTAYWSFDNTLTDEAHGVPGTASSVSNKLTLLGAAAQFDQTGKFGPCYSNPTGSPGHAQATSSIDFHTKQGAISVSVWARVDAFDKGWQTLLSKGEGSNFRFHRAAETSAVAWFDGNLEIGMNGPPLSDRRWHHLVATQSSTSGSALYIDGNLVATNRNAGPLGNSNTLFMIGENPESDGRNWHGEIDDVAIWNRALTSAEVDQIWNNGIGRPVSAFLSPVDQDDDGLPKHWEDAHGLSDLDDGSTNVNNGPTGDPDGDGLDNQTELALTTNPQLADSDDDGVEDGVEAGNGTNPNSADTDEDGVSDGAETGTGVFVSASDTGTNPLNPDSDGDGATDGSEVRQNSDPNDPNSTPSSLILYYPFDDAGSDLVSNAAGVIDGKLLGGGSYVDSQPGFGKAFLGNRERANDAMIDTQQTARALSMERRYTAMAWVRWDGVEGGEDHMVFGMNVGLTDQIHHGLRANNDPEVDNLHFGHWGHDIDDAGTVSPHEWTHLAFSFDGSTARTFINGVQTRSKNAGPPASGAKRLVIGYTSNFGAGSFHGAIDEVKIFDEALSAPQVRQHMLPSLPPAASADAITMHRAGKVRLRVLENDRGGIDVSSLRIVAPPAFGTATVNPDGSILYEHTSGQPLTDRFHYEVASFDGRKRSSAEVVVSFSTSLRIPSDQTTLPAIGPATAYRTEEAFPGLTFNSPHDFSGVPGDAEKLFVTEGDGRIYLVPDVTAQPTNADKILVVDVSSRTHHDDNEKAFKGIAAHPNWAQNGYIFVTYNTTTTSRVSRFTCRTSPPFTADPSSELILIDQRDIGAFHNIGTCEFGSDGYLYIGFGDEGTQGDGYNNSQYINKSFWTSLLRIDVDKNPGSLIPNPDSDVPRVAGGTSGEAHYRIPPDNPFIGATSFNGVSVNPNQVRTEIAVTGLRNPWQFYLHDAEDDGVVDEIWVGDVGRGAREEISIFRKGENGGWSWREGSIPAEGTTGDRNGARLSNATLRDPLWEYTHGGGAFQGAAVVAGFLYQSEEIPQLKDTFIAADFITGNIWSIKRTEGDPEVVRLSSEVGVVALEPDPSTGEILILDRGNAGSDQGIGSIKRLLVGTDDNRFPQTLTATNVFADLTDLTPQPGVIAYEPNLRFWSDHARKTRWFSMGDLPSRLTYREEGQWEFPSNSLWVKHFDFPTEWETFPRVVEGETVLDRRPTPDSPWRRLETRILVKNEEGAYGVSYQWNNISSGAQSEANLVGNDGSEFEIPVTIDAVPSTLSWQIPSRSNCASCHTPEAGHILSFNTRQLNGIGSIAGRTGNYLQLLFEGGYLNRAPGETNLLPRHVGPGELSYSLEARVRSWLDVNCSYCHQDGGTGGGHWDASFRLPLSQTQMIHGRSVDAPLDPRDRIIVPGHPERSILYNRITAQRGYTRMPPLASEVIDLEAAEMLSQWISGEIAPLLTYDAFRLAYFGSLQSAAGDPTADPDGDQQDNREEWLIRSNPLQRNARWQPIVRRRGDKALLEVPAISNRSLKIYTSPDLQSWQLWNVPGNDGIPLNPDRPHTLPIPFLDRSQYFLFSLEER